MSGSRSAHDAGRDEDDMDSCGCDVETHDSEAMTDAELPASTGGVEAAGFQGVGEPTADENEVDACDMDFEDIEPTLDEELPASTGGVA